ncbi:MAG: esterase [Burkholderiales bacterium]|nr:esterase [Burkholderiales bacterium]
MRTLYLHGFLSSPESMKAVKLREAHRKAGIPFHCPTLHVGPKEASKIILNEIESFNGDGFCVAGSSLGGFYAAWVAEKYGVRAVVLNPAVYPWNFMDEKICFHLIPATGKYIYVSPSYREELLALKTMPPARKQERLAIFGDADEVLNWIEGAVFYKGCPSIVGKDGDHRLSDFDPLVPRIMEFLYPRSFLKQK